MGFCLPNKLQYYFEAYFVDIQKLLENKKKNPFNFSLTLRNISMVKTTVNILFMPSKMRRSSDHGGIFGLSIANVIQLAAMNTKMIKSNQFCSVRLLHWRRNLKSYKKIQ